ncbi:MAG: hypothetical protein A2X25_06980 [Chloroflexi bacterium GWB2_49_20]|nr:MAG: hypothetical protein A2X25_06980 [Chloroflexi bacterium GWB2_49_20]OGN77340.1 MAG: hypothetical protein A2X26_07695 [Chloroflexi bacterium GWC2_49_37]OGN84670.1 MAG: hypothetical protein A2X27_12915 [Chloroflexi bacterium GWD2_49_16]HBG74818.1 hypothetical protein [Anaerolineae bacterium]HCC77981.1 hypothetical protein [Anaerolineae bacterium]
MSDILQDLSPAKLTIAIEENLFAWIPVFGRMGRAHMSVRAGFKKSITHEPFALFNSVMDARLAPEQVEAAIQSVISDASLHKVPMLWWTGPSTQPADLGKRLEEHGFSLRDEDPGMAVDLAYLNENLQALPGLSIQLAQDEAGWRQWSRIMAQGFETSTPHDPLVDAWYNLLRHTDPETTLAYIGWLNDKPVATSLLFLAAGVAGIYAVCTIPEARQSGIGAWLTLHSLLQAREKEYKAGILQASKMGINVYRSLGFQEYCTISSYLWRPKI